MPLIIDRSEQNFHRSYSKRCAHFQGIPPLAVKVQPRESTWLFKSDIWYKHVYYFGHAPQSAVTLENCLFGYEIYFLLRFECYNLAPSNKCVSPRDLPQFECNDIFPLSKHLPTVCNYTVGLILHEVLCMFTVTQLIETSDNHFHIPSDSTVPVLCCCKKYQQMSTAVLLHQMSVLASSLRYVDRTNVASSTDSLNARRISVWKLQTIFVG